GRRLRQIEVDALVASRLAGDEIGALAERFRIDRNTVMSHLKRRGVPGRRWQGRTLTNEQLQAAGRLYTSGARLEIVGEHFGVDRRYLRRVLPELGFTIRSAGQQKRG